jgi:hypothetical protein
MKRLGYPLTWTTTCFIACGAVVHAHTNGRGDFVLFDDLGPPWPVHDCYRNRFVFNTGAHKSISSSSSVDMPSEQHRSWEFVVQIDPQATRKKRFHVLGTVTDVELGIVGRLPQFHGAPPIVRQEIRHVLETRNSMVTIVTGAGEEYRAFFDSRKDRFGFGDIVAASLRVRRLLSGKIFVVTSVEVFGISDSAAT